MHSTFVETKLSMREGVIRILERQLDPKAFINQNENQQML